MVKKCNECAAYSVCAPTITPGEKACLEVQEKLAKNVIIIDSTLGIKETEANMEENNLPAHVRESVRKFLDQQNLLTRFKNMGQKC